MFEYPVDLTMMTDLEYWNRTERNLGIVSEKEQNAIRNARIAVLGTGGLGAPLALNLVYAGCQDLVIADHDIVEISNLNRQPFTTADIGKHKVDVLHDRLKAIDPRVHVRSWHQVNQENIEELLMFTDIVALTLDDPIVSILVARETSQFNIPMIETWAIPLIFSWWFTPTSLPYESCYKLSTHSIPYAELANSPEYQQTIRQAFVAKLASLPNIVSYYNQDQTRFRQMMAGKISFRSFAPWVWMTGAYLAFEVIFTGILKRKPMTVAPHIHAYDLFTQKIVELPA